MTDVKANGKVAEGERPAAEVVLRRIRLYGPAKYRYLFHDETASILRLWRGLFDLKRRIFYGQAERPLYFNPNLEVFCRTSFSEDMQA